MNRVVRPVRQLWRRLTSMRTALILLFLLAVAAVPGSLLPQRPLNPDKTNSYISSHGGWGRFLDKLGMFDVFGAPWFAAIYLLLFVSLIGCLVPRIRVHARAVVRKPLPAPRHLDRLPESTAFRTSASADEYARAARSALGRRWRIERRAEESGAVTLSAEKGYSRETGNLLFHVALLVALVLIAIGRLYNYEGQRVVVEGPDNGFCNTISQYDTWKPGRFAAEGKVRPAPFCVEELTRFTAAYTAEGEPRTFRAKIKYQESLDAPSKTTTVTVNHPLRLEGDRLYLLAHGFAPQITVRMPDGTVVHDTQVFLPSDASTLLSEGAFKEAGKPGAKQDIGISGLFAPTPLNEGNGLLTSTSPQVDHPALSVMVYQGDLTGSGQPQTVYALDHSKMTRIGLGNLTEGQTLRLKNGVTVRFDGWKPWASFQVSHDPAQGYLLIAAVAMVLGLLGSLGVRRRRLWLRIAPGGGPDDRSPTVVTVGGLARSDSGHFPAEFASVVERLRSAGPPVEPAASPDVVGAGKD